MQGQGHVQGQPLVPRGAARRRDAADRRVVMVVRLPDEGIFVEHVRFLSSMLMLRLVSGLDESSGRNSTTILHGIAFPVYLVFSKINMITKPGKKHVLNKNISFKKRHVEILTNVQR